MVNQHVNALSKLFGKYPRGPLIDKLIIRCTQDPDEFRALGDVVADGPDGPTIYIDNGGDVLGVAHLDYVDWTPPKIRKSRIYCPQLDDRLGVWVLLDLLPALGVKFDVLLTDSEERGRSTASAFNPAVSSWNWLFQFDRRGVDTVQYDYETDSMSELLADVGFPIGIGSFSDICSLEHLGVWGVNVGVGYHHEHTRQCYADLTHTIEQAVRFAEFWKRHHSTRFPHIPQERSYWSSPTSWNLTDAELADEIYDLDCEEYRY